MVNHYLIVFGHLINLISKFLANDWLLLLVDLLLLVLILTLTFQEINESLLFILVHLLELFWAVTLRALKADKEFFMEDQIYSAPLSPL